MIVTDRHQKRLNRVRSKVAHNVGIPRLSVFRSNQHTWAQIIDDKHGKTLVAANSKVLKATGTKSAAAAQVGTAIAIAAIKKNIKNIRFDRGAYKYHGRVKALADAARAAGLKF